MTDTFVLGRNQFGSLNGGKNKNSIKFHTISGAGIQISRGIRECNSIAKCTSLCSGKDNRDFSTIKQLILTMDVSSVISILTVTSLNSTTNELSAVAEVTVVLDVTKYNLYKL